MTLFPCSEVIQVVSCAFTQSGKERGNIVKSAKSKQLLSVTIIFLLFFVGNVNAKAPLPEFFGVYASYDGKLTELQSHPQSQYAISGMSVMGADIISRLSGITFPQGTMEFIIFQDSATTFERIPLSKIARIDMEANTGWGGDGTKKRLKNRYHLMPDEIYMNVAPLKEMMVRVVPKSPLSPGIWAIKIGSELYDFVVGSEESSECVIRQVGATGVEYIPCSKDERTNNYNKQEGKQEYKVASVPATSKKATPAPSSSNEIWHDGVYTAYVNGIVRNTETGLEWVTGPKMNIDPAEGKEWAKGLTIDGGGWRLPTTDEIVALTKSCSGRQKVAALLEPSEYVLCDTGKGQIFFYLDKEGAYHFTNVGDRVIAVRFRNGR
jgi:hypothetical protein